MEGKINETVSKTGTIPRIYNTVLDKDGNSHILNRGANSVFISLTTQLAEEKRLREETQENLYKLMEKGQQVNSTKKEEKIWNDKWQAERKIVEQQAKMIEELKSQIALPLAEHPSLFPECEAIRQKNIKLEFLNDLLLEKIIQIVKESVIPLSTDNLK